jgi:hypothetical protein
MTQENQQFKSELCSSIISIPRNPCETCGFWSPTCDQSKCVVFQKYKEEMKKFDISR